MHISSIQICHWASVYCRGRHSQTHTDVVCFHRGSSPGGRLEGLGQPVVGRHYGSIETLNVAAMEQVDQRTERLWRGQDAALYKAENGCINGLSDNYWWRINNKHLPLGWLMDTCNPICLRQTSIQHLTPGCISWNTLCHSDLLQQQKIPPCLQQYTVSPTIICLYVYTNTWYIWYLLPVSNNCFGTMHRRSLIYWSEI